MSNSLRFSSKSRVSIFFAGSFFSTISSQAIRWMKHPEPHECTLGWDAPARRPLISLTRFQFLRLWHWSIPSEGTIYWYLLPGKIDYVPMFMTTHLSVASSQSQYCPWSSQELYPGYPGYYLVQLGLLIAITMVRSTISWDVGLLGPLDNHPTDRKWLVTIASLAFF